VKQTRKAGQFIAYQILPHLSFARPRAEQKKN